MLTLRLHALKQEPVDITPSSSKPLPWVGKDVEKFEREWSLKPVKIRGIYDMTNEVRVSKLKNGEKGFDIIVPFYTHLNDKEEPCGIMVNKGWLPHDF